MPSRALPGLGLNGFWNLGEAWKTGGDENWLKLSVLSQLVVESATAELPASPANGVMHIVPPSDATNKGKVAVRDTGVWVYFSAPAGTNAWVKDASGVDKRMMFDGTDWVAGGAKSATIEVGTVTTGAPGTPAQVTNSGTPTDAVFDFVIPKGDPGSGGGGSSATVGTLYLGATKPTDGVWLEANRLYSQTAYATLFSAVGLVKNQFNWVSGSMSSDSGWRSIAFGNGVFVALSGSAAIAATSTDGRTWTQRTLPVSADFRSVVYANGLFVAVAYGSAIAITSPDGITWTQRTLPVSANWSSVTYGNGVFVAVASGGTTAATSTDGINWTQRALPVSTSWSGVAYGNGVFVAVQSSGSAVAATSTDGITWTQRALSTSGFWRSIAFGAGRFVVVQDGGTAGSVSEDGIVWSPITLPGTSQNWQHIVFGEGVFVAIVRSSTVCATSPDGFTWTQRVMPSALNWQASAYHAGYFVAVAYGTLNFAYMNTYSYPIDTTFLVPGVPSMYPELKQWMKAS